MQFFIRSKLIMLNAQRTSFPMDIMLSTGMVARLKFTLLVSIKNGIETKLAIILYVVPRLIQRCVRTLHRFCLTLLACIVLSGSLLSNAGAEPDCDVTPNIPVCKEFGDNIGDDNGGNSTSPSEIVTTLEGTLNVLIWRTGLYLKEEDYTSQVVRKVRLKFHLRNNDTFSMDRWPDFSMHTTDHWDSPENVIVALKNLGQGIYRINKRVNWTNPPPYNEYCFSIPITLALDFSNDPLIGKKDQDIELTMHTGNGRCPIKQVSDRPHDWPTGHMLAASDSDVFVEVGSMQLAGAAIFETRVYYFPFDTDNRSYSIGLTLTGKMWPLPP
jgi:hypothetical protein